MSLTLRKGGNSAAPYAQIGFASGRNFFRGLGSRELRSSSKRLFVTKHSQTIDRPNAPEPAENNMVKLRSAIDVDGHLFPKNTKGVVVYKYCDVAAVEVEFLLPKHAVLTLDNRSVDVVSG